MRKENPFGTEIYGKLKEMQEIANQSGHLGIHDSETAIVMAYDIATMVSSTPGLSLVNLDNKIRDSIRRHLQERNGSYSGVDVFVVKWMAYAALKFSDHKSEEMKKYLTGYRKRLENELQYKGETDEEECERFSFVADMKRVIDGDDNEYPIQPVGGSNSSYPEITKQNTDFFEETYFIEAKGKDRRKLRQDVPVEWILHKIYDMTKDWNPKNQTVHKWKILYEVLLRLKYIGKGDRKKYAKYVKAVVKYCFPDVGNNFSNNLSKTRLEDDFEDWDRLDKKFFLKLRDALTAPRSYAMPSCMHFLET